MFTLKITPSEQLQSLKQLAKTFNVEDIAGYVLDNPDFFTWTASTNNRHHSRQHGLLEHTYEVVQLCMDAADKYSDQVNYKILFLAALFHDFGKLWDYEPGVILSIYDDEYGKNTWLDTKHKRIIHHISRSAIEWSKAVDKFIQYRDVEEPVLHCILSHHGFRQFGSPVFPKTREAWLLHLNDQLSARMDDCDRIDLA